MIAAPSLSSSQFLGARIARPSPLRIPSRTYTCLSPRVAAVAHASAPPRPCHARSPDQATSHYDVLGISPRATSQEIKSAYRRLARTCHPDVAAKNGTADEFMRVHAAYATLSDPDKRADYDRKLMTLKWQRRWPTRPRASSSSFSSSPSSSSTRSPTFSGHGRRSWETDQCW